LDPFGAIVNAFRTSSDNTNLEGLAQAGGNGWEKPVRARSLFRMEICGNQEWPEIHEWNVDTAVQGGLVARQFS
jgi:hypothetical protein